MTLHILMLNDSALGVYTSEILAQEAADAHRKQHYAHVKKQTLYYRTYSFEVDGKATLQGSRRLPVKAAAHEHFTSEELAKLRRLPDTLEQLRQAVRADSGVSLERAAWDSRRPENEIPLTLPCERL
jgi:hypothetical protein